MGQSLRILIIGGYGSFGGRLAELLSGTPDLCLLIAGRSERRAHAFIDAIGPVSAMLKPQVFDRNGDVLAQLQRIQPNLVVDASGPFQTYGEAPYRVVEAALATGADYLDLSDAADFVADVSCFDKAARKAGLFVLSGVSSFPALTAAVVREHTTGWQAVKRISAGIAPSPHAALGASVIGAIASYAGKRISVPGAQGQRNVYPLTETRRVTIAPPGGEPLSSRLFSAVSAPDQHILPRLWPEVEEVWLGAGPVPEIQHRFLIWLAWLVRLGLLPSLKPFVGLMAWAQRRFGWGRHRSGMFVKVEGHGADGPSTVVGWHLTAEGDDGPYIPVVAATAIIRRMAAGDRPEPGARSGAEAVTLGDYADWFARPSIQTGVRIADIAGQPLYQRILGEAWDRLPVPIRQMHDIGTGAMASGRAQVRRGKNPMARLAALIFGFPPSSEETAVQVTFTEKHEMETWSRQFGPHRFRSYQSAGKGRADGLLCERFGSTRFDMALVWDGERLVLKLLGWRALGVPLPLWLGPKSEAYEMVDAEGRFRFHVSIRHWLTGPIVTYDGWLDQPAAARSKASQ